MALRIRDRVVVFDYGEVISLTPTEADRAELLAIADVPADAFWAGYDAYRADLDGGAITSDEYWRADRGGLRRRLGRGPPAGALERGHARLADRRARRSSP